MKLQVPKGCRDFFPAEMAIRNWIVDRWQDVSVRNGFVEYDGPIFETLDLYRIKSGDEIVSQLFHFEDRGGREFAIRPEMTPTLARMVAARANSLSKPIKWYSRPRLCRAERPQRGRLREFFQWNIDILGEEGEIADAECVFVAIDFFRSMGLTADQVEIKINSRAIVSSLLHSVEIVDEQLPAVYAALDKRDKLSTEAFAEMIGELGLTEKQQDVLLHMGEAKGEEGFAKVESLLAGNEEGTEQYRSLRDVFALLKSMGVEDYCTYDMGVVRGLAYYTGMVFEAFGKGGLKRAICGGGRYDRLVSDLGGPPMGGVGFATSDVVVQDVLAEYNLLPDLSSAGGFFVIDSDAERFEDVLAIVSALRNKGINAQFSYKRQGVNKQFKQATAMGAGRVVIVESDYVASKAVSLKDMGSGKQVTIGVEELLRNPFCEVPE